ncbi:RNA polymerase factor sigma-54 [Pelagicoccus sp. SDUM812003]|uniref:RNA polymerase factor sigma-54 n=1 Tax=Pelagicoccus sp. SDUM812003 TaxID=3041267 RepID=UPI0028107136|nr:RNA polymerase factor sigma-54 [Pelagicoccus sp. SDUM812003]MDQ8203120.1 RNA polymerase factor sigma-54 [Pelagicoccus sp. SDUM812003]
MAAQGFNQELRLKQTQSLVLAPQLRQSLKILQVAQMDLRATIQEELQTNPSLEELSMDTPSLDEPAPESESSSEDSNSNAEELEFGENFEVLNKLDEDWRDYMSQAGGAQTYTSEDAEKREHFFNSLVSETSLQEHLLEQASLSDIEPVQREAIEYLVGSIDNNGFLSTSLSDLALLSGLSLGQMQEAHQILRSFDPAGIAAFDLQDCLSMQLEAKGRSRSYAYEIVQKHFKLLSRRRIPDIARRLGVDVEEVQEAIAEIALLDPAPGRRFAEDNNRSVMPDVIVEWDDDKWKVTLNSDYIPRLRISPIYKEMIAKGAITKKEKEYIQEKMRSGKFLINSIEQRQQTIERIANEIVKIQADFLEEGVSKLRPCTMTQIAEIVGVHETTVSRAIANKYIQTPHGLFELKFFFTPGYQGTDGESISNTSVKDMIQNLISGEDPAKPLSDQEIVSRLQAKDIKIARRTVAKYREELGILPSNLRRQY